MDVAVFIVFLIFAFAGLVSIVFGLPGNFIILADCLLYGWYGGFKLITLNVIIVLIVLAAVAEALEFTLGVAGAKKWKSSNKAVVASIAGGLGGAVVGAPLFFGAGAVLGAFIGAFLGAFLVEYVRGLGLKLAVESGWGVFVGKVGGMAAKGLLSVVMIVISIVSVMRHWY